jgi:hypothetical protein
VASAKIDLKARLGRKTAGTEQQPSQSIPPPAASLAGAMSSPPSPFASAPPTQRQVSPSFSPFDPVPASVPRAGQPIIAAPSQVTFQVDEEALADARKQGRGKVIALAAGVAVVAGIIGYAVGGLSEKNRVAERAVAGAEMLVTEIEAADTEIEKLSTTLQAAGKTLLGGKFPEEEVKALGAINIPFDGTNLAGKGIGRFRPQVATMLINYASGVAKANDQKERIQGLLSISRQPLEELLQQKDNPKVRWSVSVTNGPQGPWATMQLLPAPFAVQGGDKGKGGGWPSEFEIPDGKGTTKLTRYTNGDPSDKIIPVAPMTESAVCPVDTIVRLRRELAEIEKILKGDETPGREVTGILPLGKTLQEQLKKIGASSAEVSE